MQALVIAASEWIFDKMNNCMAMIAFCYEHIFALDKKNTYRCMHLTYNIPVLIPEKCTLQEYRVFCT
jgi:hypothetical protein